MEELESKKSDENDLEATSLETSDDTLFKQNWQQQLPTKFEYFQKGIFGIQNWNFVLRNNRHCGQKLAQIYSGTLTSVLEGLIDNHVNKNEMSHVFGMMRIVCLLRFKRRRMLYSPALNNCQVPLRVHLLKFEFWASAQKHSRFFIIIFFQLWKRNFEGFF